MDDDGLLLYYALKAFFKEMQGLIWALHSWQASRPLARQDSCLNKLPAVRPSTPSWLQETTLRFVRDQEQPFWIKLHKNNTGVLGLSVPQGNHNSSAIITETRRALKMMYRCMANNVFYWNNIFRLINGDSRGVRHPDWCRFSFDCTEITEGPLETLHGGWSASHTRQKGGSGSERQINLIYMWLYCIFRCRHASWSEVNRYNQ